MERGAVWRLPNPRDDCLSDASRSRGGGDDGEKGKRAHYGERRERKRAVHEIDCREVRPVPPCGASFDPRHRPAPPSRKAWIRERPEMRFLGVVRSD
jgi:hypothetical protein